MRLYRLGTFQHPVWDGAGAALHGGRWNPPGVPVIYAAGSLALAMLERLVQRRALGATLVVDAVVPDDVPWTDLLEAPPAGWRALGSPAAVAAGEVWLREGQTALLRVPSALVPSEPNWMINVRHPDANRIEVSAPETLEWDPRLFGVPAPSCRPMISAQAAALRAAVVRDCSNKKLPEPESSGNEEEVRGLVWQAWACFSPVQALVFQDNATACRIVEFQRHFPLISDGAKARECVRIIAGWKSMPARKPEAAWLRAFVPRGRCPAK